MTSLLRPLRRLLDGIYLGGAILAALCLAAIAVLVLAQVVARWFGGLVPSAEELAGFLMAAATFLALAWTLRGGGHVRVQLLVRRLGARARRWQEILVTITMLALTVSLAWSSTELVLESHAYGDVSSGYVPVPLWIPQLPMAVGLVVLALALLDELVAQLSGKQASWLASENSRVTAELSDRG